MENLEATNLSEQQILERVICGLRAAVDQSLPILAELRSLRSLIGTAKSTYFEEHCEFFLRAKRSVELAHANLCRAHAMATQQRDEDGMCVEHHWSYDLLDLDPDTSAYVERCDVCGVFRKAA